MTVAMRSPLDRLTGRCVCEHVFAIGRHVCDACGTETPDPPQEVVDAITASDDRPEFLWPFDHWHPTGWMLINTEREDEHHAICASCADEMWRALGRLKVEKKRKP